MKKLLKIHKLPFYSFYLIICLIIAIISFLFGIHWQANLGIWLSQNNKIRSLQCFGYNNLTETYQLDCYTPITQKFKTFKNHMSCHIATNQQFGNAIQNMNLVLLAKADYMIFNIDIDEKSKKLTRSNEGGEVAQGAFSITQNDSNVLQATRVASLGKFGWVYEFITISKHNGIGMRVWSNMDNNSPQSDNLSSYFFQCD